MTIKVDPKFLENLASRLGRVASSLRQYSSHGSNRLSSAPRVAGAYAELGRKWDERREKLAKNLDGLADAFMSAKREFVQIDKELADSLDTGSPASTSSAGGTIGSAVPPSRPQVRSMDKIRKDVEAQEDIYLKHWLKNPANPEWDKDSGDDEVFPPSNQPRPFDPTYPDKNMMYAGQCTAWVAFKLNIDQLPHGTEVDNLGDGDVEYPDGDRNRFHNNYGGSRWGDASKWPPKNIDGVTVYTSDEMPADWPKRGQVAQWIEGGHVAYGHVAYVENVTEDTIVISEMNYGEEHEASHITTDTGVAKTREIRRHSEKWPDRFISIDLPKLDR